MERGVKHTAILLSEGQSLWGKDRWVTLIISGRWCSGAGDLAQRLCGGGRGVPQLLTPSWVFKEEQEPTHKAECGGPGVDPHVS